MQALEDNVYPVIQAVQTVKLVHVVQEVGQFEQELPFKNRPSLQIVQVVDDEIQALQFELQIEHELPLR
jgi:hypothetical protein